METWKYVLNNGLRLLGTTLFDLSEKIGDQRTKSAFDLLNDAFFEYVEGVATDDEQKVERGRSDFLRLAKTVARSGDERVIEAVSLLRGLMSDANEIRRETDWFLEQVHKVQRDIVRLSQHTWRGCALAMT